MTEINFTYIPILSLKPAEMAAVEEFSNKDKDLILPLISLKKWMNSRNLSNSILRIEKAFSKRKWIADIDKMALVEAKTKLAKSKDNALRELLQLSESDKGYFNWFNFISENEYSIPVLQLDDINSLDQQVYNFLSLKRIIVVRFELTGKCPITPENFNKIIRKLSLHNFPNGLVIILDYGDLNQISMLEHEKYSVLLNKLNQIMPKAYYAVSGTSFPYSFSGSYRGEVPIYERQIFNKVKNNCQGIKLIYSDRASTRALPTNGGAGTPPPRIDYALKNDWRFIRKELDPDINDKESLYKDAANEIMRMDYWNPSLRLWGTQMIEKTSLGDPFGITNANKATAVRINLHLYQQLHYDDIIGDLDTEEEWID